MRKEAGLFCGSFPPKGEVFAYLGIQTLNDLKDACVKGPSAMPFCRSFPREGKVFAFLGSTKNLKDLKA